MAFPATRQRLDRAEFHVPAANLEGFALESRQEIENPPVKLERAPETLEGFASAQLFARFPRYSPGRLHAIA